MRRTANVKARKPAFRGAIVVLVLALASACGGNEQAGQPPTGQDAADLVIEQVIEEGETGYVEGSWSYIAIKRSDDETIVERRLPVERRPSVRIALDPGDYVLLSWQRACDGDCSKLGAPRDHCERPIDVDPNASVRATIHVRPFFGCEITIE